ncbi:hypothetical protein A2354_01105 [Candidatus Amesbacteria bacterium RIFOXYB1_FULL_47_12]|nr:MAG: hypothetical protein A2354_01105 [Candidatus Amesbacteria bacterium RIFOXYB1_FULL_47_12]
MPKHKSPTSQLEKLSHQLTAWMGTPASLVIHTLVFTAAFLLMLTGIRIDQILLTLTTFLSVEAIYLALFIQMTVNRQAASLSEVEEDIEEVQEDVEDISEDIDKIQAADTADDQKDQQLILHTQLTLQSIENQLNVVQTELQNLKIQLQPRP